MCYNYFIASLMDGWVTTKFETEHSGKSLTCKKAFELFVILLFYFYFIFFSLFVIVSRSGHNTGFSISIFV